MLDAKLNIIDQSKDNNFAHQCLVLEKKSMHKSIQLQPHISKDDQEDKEITINRWSKTKMCMCACE